MILALVDLSTSISINDLLTSVKALESSVNKIHMQQVDNKANLEKLENDMENQNKIIGEIRVNLQSFADYYQVQKMNSNSSEEHALSFCTPNSFDAFDDEEKGKRQIKKYYFSNHYVEIHQAYVLRKRRPKQLSYLLNCIRFRRPKFNGYNKLIRYNFYVCYYIHAFLQPLLWLLDKHQFNWLMDKH